MEQCWNLITHFGNNFGLNYLEKFACVMFFLCSMTTAIDSMYKSSISILRKHLKTHLSSHSFPESPVVPVQ